METGCAPHEQRHQGFHALEGGVACEVALDALLVVVPQPSRGHACDATDCAVLPLLIHAVHHAQLAPAHTYLGSRSTFQFLTILSLALLESTLCVQNVDPRRLGINLACICLHVRRD